MKNLLCSLLVVGLFSVGIPSSGQAEIRVTQPSDKLTLLVATSDVMIPVVQVSLLFSEHAPSQDTVIPNSMRLRIEPLTNHCYPIITNQLPLRSSIQFSPNPESIAKVSDQIKQWIDQEAISTNVGFFRVILTMVLPKQMTMPLIPAHSSQRTHPDSPFHINQLLAIAPSFYFYPHLSTANPISAIAFAHVLSIILDKKQNTHSIFPGGNDSDFYKQTIPLAGGVLAFYLPKYPKLPPVPLDLVELFKIALIPPTAQKLLEAQQTFEAQHDERRSNSYTWADYITNLEITSHTAQYAEQILPAIKKLTPDVFANFATSYLLSAESLWMNNTSPEKTNYFQAIPKDTLLQLFSDTQKTLSWSPPIRRDFLEQPWNKSTLPIGSVIYSRNISDPLFLTTACYSLEQVLANYPDQAEQVIHPLQIYFDGKTHPSLPISIRSFYIANALCLEVSSSSIFQQAAHEWLFTLTNPMLIGPALDQASNLFAWKRYTWSSSSVIAQTLKNHLLQSIPHPNIIKRSAPLRWQKLKQYSFLNMVFSPSLLTVFTQGNVDTPHLQKTIANQILLNTDNNPPKTLPKPLSVVPATLLFQRNIGLQPANCSTRRLNPQKPEDFLWIASKQRQLAYQNDFFFLQDASSSHILVGYCVDSNLPQSKSVYETILLDPSPPPIQPVELMGIWAMALFISEKTPISQVDTPQEPSTFFMASQSTSAKPMPMPKTLWVKNKKINHPKKQKTGSGNKKLNKPKGSARPIEPLISQPALRR